MTLDFHAVGPGTALSHERNRDRDRAGCRFTRAGSTAAGGSFKRFWLHWMLRLTVRRAPVLGEDIGVQRAKHERLDAKFGRVDPAVRRTPVDAGGVACGVARLS